MGIKSDLLVQATKYNNKKIVKFTLDFFNILDRFFSYFKREESFNSKDNKHLNDPLAYAIENLNCDVIGLFVDAGADVHLLDKDGENIKRSLQARLVQAAELDNIEVVKSTLSALNTLYPKEEKSLNNQYLSDALACAAKNLNGRMIRSLVNEGADVNSLDENGKNAITYAVEKLATLRSLAKSFPVLLNPTVQFLLKKGSKYENKEHLNEALIYVRENLHDRGTIELLVNAGADVNLLDENGNTQNIETQFIDDKVIYEDIDDFRQDIDGSLEDSNSFGSGYSSTEESETQSRSSEQEPIYAKVDFAAKRKEKEQKAKLAADYEKDSVSGKPVVVGVFLKSDVRYPTKNDAQFEQYPTLYEVAEQEDSGYVSEEEPLEKLFNHYVLQVHRLRKSIEC